MVEARLSASLLDGKNILRMVGHMIGDPPILMESNWNGECKAHSNQASEASVKVAISHLPRAKRFARPKKSPPPARGLMRGSGPSRVTRD